MKVCGMMGREPQLSPGASVGGGMGRYEKRIRCSNFVEEEEQTPVAEHATSPSCTSYLAITSSASLSLTHPRLPSVVAVVILSSVLFPSASLTLPPRSPT